MVKVLILHNADRHSEPESFTVVEMPVPPRVGDEIAAHGVCLVAKVVWVPFGEDLWYFKDKPGDLKFDVAVQTYGIDPGEGDEAFNFIAELPDYYVPDSE